MGQFSWITSDTDKSVLTDGSVKVKMLSPDGRVFEETNYEGYGVFGGMDYFALLAQLNSRVTRQDGIDLLFEDNQNGLASVAAERGLRLPKIVSIDAVGEYEDFAHTESCPNQGWSDHAEEGGCYYCGEQEGYCTCDDEDEYL